MLYVLQFRQKVLYQAEAESTEGDAKGVLGDAEVA
jgi:hypothetical protein